MINAADRELCEALYAKYGWDSLIPCWWAKSSYSGQWTIVPSKEYKVHEFADEPGAGSFYDHQPAYDLDFLIEKLPKRGEGIETTAMLGRNTDNTGWCVVYLDLAAIDEKASNAVAKLLLKLPDTVAGLL
jgi:hypothetical protein